MKIDVFKNGGATFVPPVLLSLRDFYRKMVALGQILFVVSAAKNITRLLSHIVFVFFSEDKKHNGRYAKYFKQDLIETLLEKFYSKHIQLITSIFLSTDLKKATNDFRQIFSELKVCISLLNEGDNIDKVYPLVLKYGELASSSIFAHFLRSLGIQTELLDVRKYLTTTSVYEGASLLKLDNSFLAPLSNTEAAVVQGFIGLNKEGEDTNLGYDGSDLSAAYFLGGVIDAGAISSLTYWKDVNKFYLEDPFNNPNAKSFYKMPFSQYEKLPSFPIRLDAVRYAISKGVNVNMGYLSNPNGRKAVIYPD